MVKQKYLLLLFILSAFQSASAQNSVLDIGPRFQKAIDLYYENGVSLNYSDRRLMPDRLYFGLNFYTSRLGTAYHSNAIKQNSFLLSPAYYFRRTHLFRPFARLNIGYFSADYGSPIFDVLPSTSKLLSPEAGISIQTHIPLKISASLGYNLVTSNGLNNVPGTIYPFYYQLTVSWNILNRKK
jgi:hypothetical protein